VDFGIAKRLGTEALQPLTQTMQQVMTLEYASPEQVRGEAITPASDIFSLGVVLYRLLADQGPYPAPTTSSHYELTRAICDAEPLPPSRLAGTRALRRRLAGDLDAVVLMALRKDPARRYGSADAFADDLFRHLEGLPVQARRGAWSYRAGRFMLRHRAAVGAALVANLALVAGLGLAAYEGVEANRQKQRAERHFASVRKLANVFIFDVHKALERLPGSLAARKTLVDTALAYLQQLSTESRGDPSLQLELAAGFRNIGDIQGGGTSAGLGDTKGALASFDRAFALVEPLRGAGPLQRAAQTEFVALTARKGALLAVLGRWQEAKALELQGLAVAQSLAAAAPADYAAQRLVATQYRFLTSLYQRLADGPAFDANFAAAVAQLERLHAQRPDDLDTVIDLGYVYRARAVHLNQNIDTPEAKREALDSYQKSLDVLGPAYQKNPLNAVLASDYGKTEGYAGQQYTLLRRPAEALPHLRHAVEISSALVAKDPADVRSRTEQTEAHGRLSVALLELHDVGPAVSEAEKALALYNSLPESVRDEVVIQFNGAVALHQLGTTLEARAKTEPAAARQADIAAACAHYREAQRLLDKNIQRRPASPMTAKMIADMAESLQSCPAV